MKTLLNIKKIFYKIFKKVKNSNSFSTIYNLKLNKKNNKNLILYFILKLIILDLSLYNYIG
jgi:hypothetical protein